MQAIGDRWEYGSAEIYQDRRSCESVTQLLPALNLLVVAPIATAPSALAASICDDPFSLPLRMIEFVLRDVGWNAVFLGGPLPAATVCRAIERQRPRMFCMSVSSVSDIPSFLTEYTRIRAACDNHTALVVGGRALHADLRKQMEFSAYCDNLRQLSSCASSLSIQRPMSV